TATRTVDSESGSVARSVSHAPALPKSGSSSRSSMLRSSHPPPTGRRVRKSTGTRETRAVDSDPFRTSRPERLLLACALLGDQLVGGLVEELHQAGEVVPVLRGPVGEDLLEPSPAVGAGGEHRRTPLLGEREQGGSPVVGVGLPLGETGALERLHLAGDGGGVESEGGGEGAEPLRTLVGDAAQQPVA